MCFLSNVLILTEGKKQLMKYGRILEQFEIGINMVSLRSSLTFILDVSSIEDRTDRMLNARLG